MEGFIRVFGLLNYRKIFNNSTLHAYICNDDNEKHTKFTNLLFTEFSKE